LPAASCYNMPLHGVIFGVLMNVQQGECLRFFSTLCVARRNQNPCKQRVSWPFVKAKEVTAQSPVPT
jgi:hypothetical protein